VSSFRAALAASVASALQRDIELCWHHECSAA